MTTRRRRLPGPPPPRGRSGRFGLLPPLGMRPSSVKTRELRIDPDGLAQRVRKAPAGARALETGESPACVDAPPFAARGGDQDPLTGGETDELALRRAPPAAGAPPVWLRHYSASACGSAASGTGTGAGVSVSGAGSGSPPTRSEPLPSSAWWAGTPQKREPGRAALGHRLPLARIAPQRPERSSPSPPPPKATSASACANSVSLWISIFQPVRRAARRAFIPSLPIASASWSLGTTAVASLASSSRWTSR